MVIEIVSVPLWGVLKHRGLKVTLPSGQSWVYANNPVDGVTRQSFASFAEGRPWTSNRYDGPQPAAAIVHRAEQLLGRPYDLLRWNCDHFVTAALGDEPASKQLQGIFWTLGGLWFLSRLTT